VIYRLVLFSVTLSDLNYTISPNQSMYRISEKHGVKCRYLSAAVIPRLPLLPLSYYYTEQF